MAEVIKQGVPLTGERIFEEIIKREYTCTSCGTVWIPDPVGVRMYPMFQSFDPHELWGLKVYCPSCEKGQINLAYPTFSGMQQQAFGKYRSELIRNIIAERRKALPWWKKIFL